MTLETTVERVSEGRNLLENLRLIDTQTWQTSQEVFRDWNNGASVIGVNTANLAVYRLVDGEVVFDLLGREENPFCDERFQEEVYNGILNNDFFSPQGAMKEHIQAAIQPDATVRYSGLRVETKDCGPNYGYVKANKRNNNEEKKLFALVYGTENPGKGKRVYLLMEEVVKAQLHEKKDDLIADACYFNDCQDFFAYDNNFLDCFSAVCGVLQAKRAEVAGQKVPCAPQETDKVRTAYATLREATLNEAEMLLESADFVNRDMLF